MSPPLCYLEWKHNFKDFWKRISNLYINEHYKECISYAHKQTLLSVGHMEYEWDTPKIQHHILHWCIKRKQNTLEAVRVFETTTMVIDMYDTGDINASTICANFEKDIRSQNNEL